jgi:peptide/nickel transport system substrate-binding protein
VFGERCCTPGNERGVEWIDRKEKAMSPHKLSRRRVIQTSVAGAGALAASSLLNKTGAVAPELAAAQEDERGILIMSGGGSSMPENFNPLITDARVWLYDGLVRFDEQMNPIPDLAESWEISDDGTVYSF